MVIWSVAANLTNEPLRVFHFNDSTFQRITLAKAIIRSALEVNPFLTISALTERIVENIVASLTH